MARTGYLIACVMVSVFVLNVAADVVYTGKDPYKFPTFYDALVADSSNHNLIMTAVSKDTSTLAMLKSSMNVTAFVPTDKAFILAALTYKMGTDYTKLMSNTCLIRAILNYHIIRGPGMKVTKLLTLSERATQFNDTTIVTPTPLKLKFKNENGNLRVIAGGTNGLITAPYNIGIKGGGFKHNIDTLLLPTTDMTKFSQITGCSLS